MEMWQDHSQNSLQCKSQRGNLNFSTLPEISDDVNNQKKKLSRDPLSHRIIEKRRRDRMNNCLADLSRLIPSNFVKKSRGRIEKTEIIEMAIKHLKQLMFRASNSKHTENANTNNEKFQGKEPEFSDSDQYCLGFQECMSETLNFLDELDGICPGEGLCMRLVNHLHNHLENIIKGFHGSNTSDDNQSVCTKICDTDEKYDDGSNSPQYDRFTPPSSSDTFNSNAEKDEYCTSPKPQINLTGSNDDVYMNDVNSMISEQSQVIFRSKLPTNGDQNRLSGNGSDGGGFGSQLREMLLLQNPADDGSQTQSPVFGRPIHAAASPGRNCSSRDSARSGNGGGGEEVYKFKTNIKERFRADQRTTWTDDGDEEKDNRTIENKSKIKDGSCRVYDPVMIEARPSVLTSVGQMQCVSSSNSNSKTQFTLTAPISCVSKSVPSTLLPSGVNEQISVGTDREAFCQEIPIFALHPKGNFYIPMILDGEMLEPYMKRVTLTPAETPLHHIGISVHFLGGPIRVPWLVPPSLSAR